MPSLLYAPEPSLDWTRGSLNALKSRSDLNGALWWRRTEAGRMASPAWVLLCVTSALLASGTLGSLGSHSRRIHAIYPSTPQASQQQKPRGHSIPAAEDAQVTRDRQRTSTVTHGKTTQQPLWSFPPLLTWRHTERIIEMPLYCLTSECSAKKGYLKNI